MNFPATESRDRRREDAAIWAAEQLGLAQVDLQPVCGDASFRRYFRFHSGDRSVILMDAPRYRESSERFLDAGERLSRAGLKTPDVYAFDLDLGFGLLEDFGDVLYREILTPDTVDSLFPRLFDILEVQAKQVDPTGLPEYNEERLQMELDLLPDWYLAKHKHRELDAAELSAWRDLCARLINSAQAQPQVFVHRDYHSRNLMVTEDGPGILDFQDAMEGPLTYDLVSLLKDCYVKMSPEKVTELVAGFAHDARRLGVHDLGDEQYLRSFDLTGVQRHLKAAGIFARLNHRDGKSGYLADVPRTLSYIVDLAPRYGELGWLVDFIDARVLPRLESTG